MCSISLGRLEEVMAYLNEHGETETCSHYGINTETLHRYQRKMRFYETKQPKVLLFDIETTPFNALLWGSWKQRIPHTSIMDESILLSWSAKWLFDSKIHSDILTPTEAINKDDSRVVRSLWDIINRADVLIAHNGKRFDVPFFKMRALLNKLAPPSPYQVIDTLEVLKKNFRFPSNKLDYIGTLLRNKGKIKTDFDLWVRCLKGESSALAEMLAYNKEDVVLLEDAYVWLRPYINSHPNMAIYQESHEPSCPTCGSSDIEECGHYTTSVNRYLAFRCKNCGAICRSRSTDIPLKVKSGILHPVAR